MNLTKTFRLPSHIRCVPFIAGNDRPLLMATPHMFSWVSFCVTDIRRRWKDLWIQWSGHWRELLQARYVSLTWQLTSWGSPLDHSCNTSLSNGPKNWLLHLQSMIQRLLSLNWCLSVCIIRNITVVWTDRLCEEYYKDEAEFLSKVEEDSTAFKPHGDLIYSYTRLSPAAGGKGKGTAPPDPESEDAVVFEVYHVCICHYFFLGDCVTLVSSQSTWNTPGFKEYHRRMQLFILLYIEAGSYINEAEDQWEFVVLWVCSQSILSIGANKPVRQIWETETTRWPRLLDLSFCRILVVVQFLLFSRKSPHATKVCCVIIAY